MYDDWFWPWSGRSEVWLAVLVAQDNKAVDIPFFVYNFDGWYTSRLKR